MWESTRAQGLAEQSLMQRGTEGSKPAPSTGGSYKPDHHCVFDPARGWLLISGGPVLTDEEVKVEATSY
jgi:hypothetical protein